MSSSRPYKIEYTGHTKSAIRSLLESAKKIGTGAEVRDLMIEIVHLLSQDPLGFADFAVKTGPDDLVQCQATHRYLFVWYLVSEKDRVVILCDLSAVVGHPLAAP